MVTVQEAQPEPETPKQEPEAAEPVSYTHLDVYKRQGPVRRRRAHGAGGYGAFFRRKAGGRTAAAAGPQKRC